MSLWMKFSWQHIIQAMGTQKGMLVNRTYLNPPYCKLGDSNACPLWPAFHYISWNSCSLCHSAITIKRILNQCIHQEWMLVSPASTNSRIFGAPDIIYGMQQAASVTILPANLLICSTMCWNDVERLLHLSELQKFTWAHHISGLCIWKFNNRIRHWNHILPVMR